MGSCEYSCGVLCMKVEGKLDGAEGDPDGDVNAGCSSHVDGLGLVSGVDGRCSSVEDSGNGVKGDPASAVDRSLELSQSDDGNAGCLSRVSGVKEIVGVDGRCGLVEELVLGDECGVSPSCFGQGQNGSDGDILGSQEPCLEKVVSGDEHYVRMVSSLEDSMKVMSTSCRLRSCDQQGEAKTDEGLRAESVSLGNGNHICLVRDEESHLAPITFNSDEQGLKDVRTICSLSVDGGGFVMQHKKTGQGINHLSSYEVIQDFAEENIEQCTKISSPQACDGTLETLPLADSPNNCAPKSKLTNERSLVSPLMDRVSEAVVGKTDVHTIDTKVATCVPILCLKVKGYDLGGSLPETTLKPSIEKPALQVSDQLLGVAEDNLSSMSDRPHISAGDVFGEMKSDVTADFSGQSSRPNCLSQSSCPLVSSSTSQGCKQGCTKSEKTQRKHSARKCRKGTPDLDLNGHLESLISVRRKRSSFSKPHRASVWGLLGNIAQLFMPSDGCESNQNQSHGSRHLKGSPGSGKQNSIMAGSYPRELDAKSSVTRIHLKVKFGNQANKSTDTVNTDIIHTSESDDTVICNSGTNSYHRTSSGVPNLVHVVQDRVEDEKSEKQLLPLENKLEKASTSPNGSIDDFFLTNKDSDGTMVSAVSVGDAVEEYLRASVHLEVETLDAAKEKRDADPATSPDSEVSNFVPDGHLRARGHKNIPSSALFSSKRGEDKCTINQEGGYFLEDGSSNAVSTNKVKPLKKRVGRLDSARDNCFDEFVGSSISGNGSCNSSSSKGLSPEQVPYSTETEIEVLREAFQVERGTDAQVCGSLNGDDRASELQNSDTLLPLTKPRGRRLRRKSDAVSKRRSSISAPKSRQCNDDKKKGNEQNMANMNKLKEKRNCNHVQTEEDVSETGKCVKNEVGQINGGDHIASTNVTDANITSAATEQYLPVDNAWVRCDDCHKWRRISEELADSIGQTNCRWICEDNADKAFTDCSIPQEMSNSEINAELGIADADEDVFDTIPSSMASECSRTTVYKEYQFLHISTNQFLHRNRKTQTIDEIMVCGCKPPQDGRLGCRDGCLNRMLNIECIRGTCPCGDLCSNQQFQKRNYAKMKWDRFGKKGFGLRLDEDVYKGQFLIEYVGEVLDMRTYQARLKEYASMGHKHFYFMTLSSSEVIDASAKGNLGRFINHSCDPNCRTEKWVVNGEICIGLFALRDVKKGEEVTFDYNYVRVVGAAAKKCYCGSLQCRGYIGGDPTNAEVVDHVDSDEEFPEPVMLEEGETGNVSKDGITRTSSFEEVEMQVFESMSVDGSFMAKSNGTTATEGVASETEGSTNPLHTSMDLDGLKRSSFSPTGPVDVPQQVDYESIRPSSSVQPEILMDNNRNKTSAIRPDVVPLTPLLTKLSSDCTVAANKSKSASAGEKRVFVKSRFYIKTSGQSGILKNGKHSENLSNSRKVKVMPNRSETHSLRPKTLLEGVANGRFETVEEKLNELLDVDGGISKRKDSPRGYLQLLHLIAASGSSGNGETIQSNRDLSMILDAILKTKSRMVLVDIINKNVLQKLHNMMKKCRRDFKKLPILRKVLKVLEFLAIREALTLEHISKGPPHPGVESFIESMLSLTEHDDKQVHQIARSFRDRWIPRHVRKICYLDRDERKTRLSRGSNSDKVPTSHNMQDDGMRPTETLDTVPEFPTTPVDIGVNGNHSASCIGGGTKTRKRKTRWDQDKPVWISTNCDEQKIEVPLEQVSELKTSHNIAEETPDRVEREDVSHPHAACAIDDGKQYTINDVPPGFSSSVSKKTSSVSPSTITDMLQQASPESLVIGYRQKKFISHLPVSYGIPLPIVRQLGPSQAEIVESCIIAPGIAFHPFPPLPPVVHPSKGTLSWSANSIGTRGASETQQGSQNPATSYVTENSPSTSGAKQSDMDHPGPNDQQAFKRPKVSSHDLGRRYFRQQKWHKMPAPWIRNGTRWGYSGNNLRAGMCARNIGNPAKEHMDSSFQMM